MNTNSFVDFITNHWVLVALLAVVCLAWMVNELFHSRLGGSEVSPEQAVQLMNHQNAVILDFRNETLFAAGHVLGAEHVSVPMLERKMGALQKYLKKPIIVIVGSDMEAPKTIKHLKATGFTQVLLLRGGMQAWQAAALPIVKK